MRTSPTRFLTLPLAIAAIFTATAIPVGLRGHPTGVALGPSLEDFVLNVVLYLPLGLALYRRRLWTVTVGATVGAALIELGQMWFFGRFASAPDVVANAAGAGAGVLLGRVARQAGLSPDLFRVSRRASATILLAASGLLVLWHPSTAQQSPFATWDASYPLVAGNDLEGTRPWHGTIELMWLLSRPLSRDALSRPGRPALQDDGAPGFEVGPFQANGRPIPLGSPEASRKFTEAAVADGFTIVAAIRPATVDYDRPARILASGADPERRNFLLTQEGARIAFRLRPPEDVTHLRMLDATTADLLKPHRLSVISATYDGRMARVYVDGRQEARVNAAAAGCWFEPLCESTLPLAAAGLGAALGITALAAINTTAATMAGLAAVAAIVAGGLVRATHAGALSPEFGPWLPLFAAAGAGVAACSAWRGDLRAPAARPSEE